MPQPQQNTVASRLLAWYDRHGRHDLPWQHPRSAYRVWVAEIMLQQTRVQTVIGYFERFMARFPDVHALAAADDDSVMQHWAGLGYYARARNLHAAARRIVADHDGMIPSALDELRALPGIGRSTAGAIRAQAFDLWAPILDGNAKRVLARLAAIETRSGTAAHDKALWPLAELHTPHKRVADYTQAIMDLGATVCTRRNPDCAHCPLQPVCQAAQQGRQAEIPVPRKRASHPQRRATLLLPVDRHGRILLEKRPPTGIWGGLWCLPVLPAKRALADHCRNQLGIEPQTTERLPAMQHVFTHFVLEITPVWMRVADGSRIMDSATAWHVPDALPGVPAPVKRLIESHLRESTNA